MIAIPENTYDVKRLIDFRDIALVTTLEDNDLKIGEVVKLTKKHIKVEGKGYKIVLEDREVPLSRRGYAWIQTWLDVRPVSSDYIFTAFDGSGPRLSDRPVSPATARNIVKKIRE